MRLDLAGLAARLERAAEGRALRPAMERGAGMLAEGVRGRLSVGPGRAHDAPWVESGALRDSIGVGVAEDGLTAVVGSNDPAAAPQEMGTARMAARPFLGPVAGEMGEEVAREIGARVAAALRGETRDDVPLAQDAFAGTIPLGPQATAPRTEALAKSARFRSERNIVLAGDVGPDLGPVSLENS